MLQEPLVGMGPQVEAKTQIQSGSAASGLAHFCQHCEEAKPSINRPAMVGSRASGGYATPNCGRMRLQLKLLFYGQY